MQFRLRWPDGLEKLVDDLVETGDFVARDAQILPQLFTLRDGQFFQFAIQELQVNVERIQRIADFVRNACGQQGDRGKFF